MDTIGYSTSEQEGYDLFNDKSNSTKKYLSMKDGKRFNSVYSNENNEYINDNVKEINYLEMQLGHKHYQY